jgi:hypothetical protein
MAAMRARVLLRRALATVPGPGTRTSASTSAGTSAGASASTGASVSTSAGTSAGASASASTGASAGVEGQIAARRLAGRQRTVATAHMWAQRPDAARTYPAHAPSSSPTRPSTCAGRRGGELVRGARPRRACMYVCMCVCVCVCVRWRTCMHTL